MITTLKHKRQFVLAASLLYLAQPLVTTVYYLTEEARNAYPPDADSIGIGIYQDTLAWLLVSPLYALLLWLAARNYKGGRTLLSFDTARPFWKTGWALAFDSLALYFIYEAAGFLRRWLPVDAASSLSWAYLFLCLRSSWAGKDQKISV